MVLTLKRWKSRSSPGIEASGSGYNPFTSHRAVPQGRPFWRLCGFAPHRRVLFRHQPWREQAKRSHSDRKAERPPAALARGTPTNGIIAGWSSPVARQAHNLKVVGSNPTPATTVTNPHMIEHITPAASLPGAMRVQAARNTNLRNL